MTLFSIPDFEIFNDSVHDSFCKSRLKSNAAHGVQLSNLPPDVTKSPQTGLYIGILVLCDICVTLMLEKAVFPRKVDCQQQ